MSSQIMHVRRHGLKRVSFVHATNGPITDKSEITYYQSLGIPPAWQQVKITPQSSAKRAKVLATGIDAAGRLQYIYHPTFRARQEQAKFERVLKFARALPQMREVVGTDLQRAALDYKKVMATIINIMDRTYIRVGNETYARTNGSYGLTTLRSKHTTIKGDTITFQFIGKSGKHHIKQITDKSLARIVKQLDNQPGYEVFRHCDSNGKLHNVSSSDVNAYIKDVMGDEFSAKDFRTWAGTLTASAELALLERAATERERKKCVSACVRKVAAKLGNTPAIARASYIDPRIITMYMGGDDLSRVWRTVSSMQQQKGTNYLSPEERCVLKILETTV